MLSVRRAQLQSDSWRRCGRSVLRRRHHTATCRYMLVTQTASEQQISNHRLQPQS